MDERTWIAVGIVVVAQLVAIAVAWGSLRNAVQVATQRIDKLEHDAKVRSGRLHERIDKLDEKLTKEVHGLAVQVAHQNGRVAALERSPTDIRDRQRAGTVTKRGKRP